MGYGLPPPWNPGYAMPKNIEDEGLERRAFVTKLLPRGSYDDPRVGDGGYAVPQYVMDEGYGQGTFTTKWQPSGTYNGPAVPNWLNKRPRVVKEAVLPSGAKQFTVQPLSGDEPLPALYEDYGAKAARIIIDGVARLPAAQRPAAMRRVLGRLDKSLWSRTEAIWNRYIKQGVAPDQAFPLALARAMSAGVAAEIINAGLTRSAPQVSSLLGLGCYTTSSRGALGAAPVVATNASQGKPQPKPAKICPAPEGYTWITAPDGTLAIQRLKPGQTPTPGPCDANGNTPVVTSTHIDQYGTIDVGGFLFDLSAPIKTWATGSGDNVDNRAKPPRILVSKASDLTPAQARTLRDLFVTIHDDGKKLTTTYPEGDCKDGGVYCWKEPDAAVWFDKIGIKPTDPIDWYTLHAVRLATDPIAWVMHPVTREKLAVHMYFAPLDRGKPGAPDNPLVIKLWLSRMPDPNWLSDSLKFIGELPAKLASLDPTGLTQATLDAIASGGKVIAAVENGIEDAIKDLTCGLAGSTAGKAAAGAAAAYVGAPPQAGVAGAQMAADRCGGGQQAPQPPVVAQASILPMLLLGGGVLAAVYAISTTRKPKATASKRGAK